MDHRRLVFKFIFKEREPIYIGVSCCLGEMQVSIWNNPKKLKCHIIIIKTQHILVYCSATKQQMYAKRKRSTKMVIAFEGTFFVEDENLYIIFCR